MVQKKLPLKTSSTINAEEKISESTKAIVEDELNQDYDKLFKDISEVRRITPEHVLNDIVNVQPMDGDLFINLFELAKKRYDKMLKERGIEPFLISDLIEGVQPMTDEEFKKFSKNSLFKINHINKDDENQKPIYCYHHHD